MIKTASAAATVTYHVLIIVLLDWRTMSATSGFSPPMYEMNETMSINRPSSSAIFNTATLSPLPESTSVQPTCFIGGRTIIEENHAVSSDYGLYLQFVKRSDCSLSKRTFGIKICYKSSSIISIEGSLWTITQQTYFKFTTLMQATLPVSLNESCVMINVSDISFMRNTFFGIAIISSSNNSGVVLNPTDLPHWCLAKGYKTNDDMVDQMECPELEMDLAVAALFVPQISVAETHSNNVNDDIEAGAIAGIVIGLLIFIIFIFMLFFVMAFYLKQRKNSYIVSKKSDDGVDKIEIFKINHFTSGASLWNDPKDNAKNAPETPNPVLSATINGGQTYERPVTHGPTPVSHSPTSVTHSPTPDSHSPTPGSPHSPTPESTAIHFTNPSFFSPDDLPPSDSPSHVHADPIFDCPNEGCISATMQLSTKKKELWKNKKLHSCLYERPAGDVRSLIRQLKKPEIKKIKRNDISIVKDLGSGAFGLVSLARWEDKDVAVKTLDSEATEKEKVKLLQEAAIMGQFFHENVSRLYAIITEEPIGIVIEFASKGDLHKFLIELRPDVMEGEFVPDSVPPLLVQFARHVAEGMHYLSSKFFVHRDLAARNILITEDLVCKLADFGMSKDLEDENFYVVSGGKIPVKWTAPEALYFKKYTTLSDVWSYGCVLYEMWSLGSRPFEATTAKNALIKISEGYRLPPPPGCPKLMYKLMIRCWHPDPESRPIFALIIKYLNKPDEELLEISEEDRHISGTKASTLGYPLSDGVNLYKDLQLVYTCNMGDKS